MFEIKPIETTYNGYKFRSRLEAKWAVFFDALNIKWEYESEGYEFGENEKYLPDFWLPTFDSGTFCEVKPDGGDFSKACRFANAIKKQVWLCEGLPDYAIYKIATPHTLDDELECAITCGLPNYDQALGENRMYGQPCEFDCKKFLCRSTRKIPVFDLGTLMPINQGSYLATIDEDYLASIKKARFARFEHGKN